MGKAASISAAPTSCPVTLIGALKCLSLSSIPDCGRACATIFWKHTSATISRRGDFRKTAPIAASSPAREKEPVNAQEISDAPQPGVCLTSNAQRRKTMTIHTGRPVAGTAGRTQSDPGETPRQNREKRPSPENRSPSRGSPARSPKGPSPNRYRNPPRNPQPWRNS